MTTPVRLSYACCRLLAEIIGQAVWLMRTAASSLQRSFVSIPQVSLVPFDLLADSRQHDMKIRDVPKHVGWKLFHWRILGRQELDRLHSCSFQAVPEIMHRHTWFSHLPTPHLLS